MEGHGTKSVPQKTESIHSPLPLTLLQLFEDKLKIALFSL